MNNTIYLRVHFVYTDFIQCICNWIRIVIVDVGRLQHYKIRVTDNIKPDGSLWGGAKYSSKI